MLWACPGLPQRPHGSHIVAYGPLQRLSRGLLTLSRPLQSLLLATLGPLLGQACTKWHLMVAMTAFKAALDGLTGYE